MFSSSNALFLPMIYFFYQLSINLKGIELANATAFSNHHIIIIITTTIILPNGTCTNQNLSWRMRCIKFSGILRFKPIPEDQTTPAPPKKKLRMVDFVVPENHRVKIKESEKMDKYLDLARGLKKLWNIESDGDNHYNWYAWNGP